MPRKKETSDLDIKKDGSRVDGARGGKKVEVKRPVRERGRRAITVKKRENTSERKLQPGSE